MKKLLLTLSASLLIIIAKSQFQIDFSIDVNKGCEPLLVTFTNNSIGPASYLWKFGDGTQYQGHTPPPHLYKGGYYNVELIGLDAGGFNIGGQWKDIVVYGADTFYTSTGSQVCPNERMFFEYREQYEWLEWDFGDGSKKSTWNHCDHKYSIAGTYNVKLIVKNQCGIDTIIKPIQVTPNAIPLATIWMEGAQEVCPNDGVSFHANEGPVSFFWDFDDGATSNQREPIHKFTLLGSKQVVLTTTNSCGNSNRDTILVKVKNNVPVYSSFYFYPQPACPDGIIQFNPHNAGQCLWSFGDADNSTSNLKNPTFIYSDTGTYNVTLIQWNGCGNRDTNTVTINVTYNPDQKPEAMIRFAKQRWENKSDTFKVCPNEEVAFTNYTWSDGSIWYLWDFGDGTYSSKKDATHSYSSNGVYKVSMIATNNCNGKDTAILWVDVNSNALPPTNLMFLPDSICPGEKVYFFNQGQDIDDMNLKFSIWFGDGDSVINLTTPMDSLIPVFYHQYNKPGNYDFIFIATNVCGNSDTLKETIVVDNNTNRKPFYYIQNSANPSQSDGGNKQTGCPGDEVEFFAVGGVSCVWHFGDGTTSNNPFTLHTYNSRGIYDAFVVITNGCGRVDTISSTVYIADSNYAQPWFNVKNLTSDFACIYDTLEFEYSDYGSKRTKNYSYFWDFGDGTTSTEQNPKHVFTKGGKFNVKFVVTNGCGSDSTVRVFNINAPQINFSVNKTSTGINQTLIFNNLTNGASSYLWNFGDGTTSTLQNPTHAFTTRGNYNITLTATTPFGCTSSFTKSNYITINDLQITSANIINPSCHGICNGEIDIVISGGDPPYIYTWSNGATTQDIKSLCADTYTVTVKDIKNNIVSASYTITQPNLLTNLLSSTNVSCKGGNNGSITLNTSGGTPPYSFLWSTGTTNQNLIKLSKDKYKVTITDANKCSILDSTEIIETSNLQITYSYTRPSCSANDGEINAEGINGSGTYTYTWFTTPIQTTPTITGLSAGAYKLRVSDGQCADSVLVNLSNIGTSSGETYNFRNVTCAGKSDGYITAKYYSASTVTYLWNTGATTATITGLSKGTYIVTVTQQDNGCKYIMNRTITEPLPISATIIKTNPLCFGGYNGSATVFASGGNLYYQYSWSNGDNEQVMLNRPAGTYTVTVSDWWGCSVTKTTTLENPLPINITMNVSNVTYYGGKNGAIDISVNNATKPLTYQWSNGSTNEDIYFLNVGTYTVTVQDANSCSKIKSAKVLQPELLNVSITSNGPLRFCYGNTVTLDAGEGFLSYNWSNGATTQKITVSESGMYIVTVSNNTSIGKDTAIVIAAKPYENEQICMVTVDTTTNKNLIVWEKTENKGIVSYNIYKETNSAGLYALIVNLPATEEGVYTDINSNPQQKSDRYRISVIDTCGNESPMSPTHKTMHLTVSTGIGVYNLIWENYEGFEFGSYLIYRGTKPNKLLPVGSIQSNLTTYTDFQNIGTYYYFISVIKGDTCFVNTKTKIQSGPYSQSMSNIDDNKVSTEVNNTIAPNYNISIYPNPYIEHTTIYYSIDKTSHVSIEVYNVLGEHIAQIVKGTQNEGMYQYDFSAMQLGFAPGIYYLKFTVDDYTTVKKIVETN